MRRLAFGLVVGITAISQGPACLGADCDRAGCEATERPVSGADIAQGVAGVVSSESDVVANDCQECPLSQATLKIWAATLPPADKAAAVSLMNTFDPIETVEVDERYSVELEPGDYLICQAIDEGVCAAFTIESGDVATVHLQARFGPSGMVVFDPGSNTARTDGIFQLEPGDAPGE